MKEKVNVVHIIGRLSFGGLEQVATNLLAKLDRDRFRPFLAALRGADDAARGALASDVSLLVLNKKSGRDWGIVFQLARFFRDQKIDVVHSHNWETWLYSYLAVRLSGSPGYVHSEHGRDSASIQDSAIRYWCRRFLARHSDHLTAVSVEIAQMLEDYLGASCTRISIIPNGVDLTRFKPAAEKDLIRQRFHLPRDVFLLGTVIGALRPVKDVITLMHAVHELVRSSIPIALVLVGGTAFMKSGAESTQEYEREVQMLIVELGLTRHVHCTGPVADVENYLPAFDVYVNSSVYEGMSVAILDAMACGVPIVATRAGGTPFIVQENETGFLVEPRSSSALAAAIRNFIDSEELRIRLGAQARKQIEMHHDQKAIVHTYEELYLRILLQ